MHVVLITSFLVGGVLIQFLSKAEKVQRNISIWGGFVLFLYAAMRSTAVGTDVYGYANAYLTLPYTSFRAICASETLVSRDPLFYLFMKILSHINHDPQFMLIVISAIVAFCLSTFAYKNSVNPILSFAMFIGFRYYSFTLSGLRQAIAWSIIFLSYESLKDKKLLKFILTVLLASLFHRSALVFMLAYPIANIKTSQMSFLVPFGLLLNFIANDIAIRLIGAIPALQQYANYIYGGETTTSGKTILFIYICIIIFAFVARKHMSKKNVHAGLMYNLTLTGVAITALGFRYPNIFRVGYYFIFPIILLFPCAINSFLDRKSQLLVNLFVIALLTAQFMIIGPGAGTGSYQFFWE